MSIYTYSFTLHPGKSHTAFISKRMFSSRTFTLKSFIVDDKMVLRTNDETIKTSTPETAALHAAQFMFRKLGSDVSHHAELTLEESGETGETFKFSVTNDPIPKVTLLH